jgi:hypothetical protein
MQPLTAKPPVHLSCWKVSARMQRAVWVRPSAASARRACP